MSDNLESLWYYLQELESESDQCAVCIEPYKLSDVIRVLPCRLVATGLMDDKVFY